MEITRESLDGYTDALGTVAETGKAALARALAAIDYAGEPAIVRRQVLAAMEQACGASAKVAARTAAEFYASSRGAVLGSPERYAVADGRERKATEEAVRAFLRKLFEEGDADEFERLCMERLDYEVRRAAGECVRANVRRDPYTPTRYARVPTGPETCGFCIMLASRGPVYHTPEAAGMYDHYHAHCVTGGTRVSGRGLLACLRREYEGPLVSITTRGGHELAVTPEHPILTARGWVVAGELEDSDRLLCARERDGHEVRVPDVQDVPPTAQEVFESAALLNAAGLGGMPASAQYLHGEALADCDVEVVDPYGFLQRAGEPKVAEPLDHVRLTMAETESPAVRLRLEAGGATGSLGDGNGTPAHRVMGGLGLCGALGRGHLCGADEACLAAVPEGDTAFPEPPGDDGPADADLGGDLEDARARLIGFDNPFRHSDRLATGIDALALEGSEDGGLADADRVGDLAGSLAGEIEVDDIVSLRVSEARCHVYNLSTRGGWFVASGIITHNCDCRVVPCWGTFEVGPSRRSSCTSIEGYDPDYYYDCYLHPERHPELREARNARRRDLRLEKKLFGGARRRTGNMTSEEFANYRRELEATRDWPQLQLPRDEYAMVTHALNTDLTDEERKRAIVGKPIGDCLYTIVNLGYGNYRVVGKTPID